MRGDVHRLRPRDRRGREQAGQRYAACLLDDRLAWLSVWVVAPTSRSARPAAYRPVITVSGEQTHVLVEQIAAVDPARLGEVVGHLSLAEARAVDQSLIFVLGL